MLGSCLARRSVAPSGAIRAPERMAASMVLFSQDIWCIIQVFVGGGGLLVVEGKESEYRRGAEAFICELG